MSLLFPWNTPELLEVHFHKELSDKCAFPHMWKNLHNYSWDFISRVSWNCNLEWLCEGNSFQCIWLNFFLVSLINYFLYLLHQKVKFDWKLWCLPYEGVLWRGLLGAPQNTDITDGCFCGVPWNKFDAESSLPKGLLLCGRKQTE